MSDSEVTQPRIIIRRCYCCEKPVPSQRSATETALRWDAPALCAPCKAFFAEPRGSP